jgi:hypothetical protein
MFSAGDIIMYLMMLSTTIRRKLRSRFKVDIRFESLFLHGVSGIDLFSNCFAYFQNNRRACHLFKMSFPLLFHEKFQYMWNYRYSVPVDAPTSVPAVCPEVRK